MTQRFVLDEIVDPFGAKVVVDRAVDGSVRGARFDLAGLPRVDSLLVGHPVAEVPSLVERLCGVCPAAHHLAGTRALEALLGVGALTPAADRARRLLHHASAISTHAVRAVTTDREDALTLRRFAKAVMKAVGSPGHFPVTAVPGGVIQDVSPEDRDVCLALVDETLDAASRIAERLMALGAAAAPFEGADVALCDAAGRPDLLGERLRAVAGDGSIVVEAASPSDWDAVVTESVPGTTAPRPYLVALGAGLGTYRVGPVAQLRVGDLTTPVAAGMQAAWLASGGAAAARAIVTVHSVEKAASLLAEDFGPDAPLTVPVAALTGASDGVGWVDGPRGLLVHHYWASADGVVTAAQILTPTAQNEPWLAQLLVAAVSADGPGPIVPGVRMEDAIREADPCLPVSLAPVGGMGLVVEESASSGPEGA